MGSLHNVREEFIKDELIETNIKSSPFEQFDSWLGHAKERDIIHWNAMTLATSDNKGHPSARTVLLKDASVAGFTFFTNYDSKKGSDLIQNKNACLLFYYRELERQIKIIGSVKKLSYEESQQYFETRPLGSQISASISNQSKKVKNREELENLYKNFEEQFQDKKIPCPQNWGGFILVPTYFEFWQGRKNRLHDRIAYDLQNNQWQISRLAP